MKRLLAIAALLVAPLGCVANQGASFVRFLNARSFVAGTTDCSTAADKYIVEGALDVSGSDNYLLAMSIESNTEVQPITINQVNYQGSGLNDITLYEVVYSYDFSDASAGITLPKEETAPIYVVFRPQATPDSSYVGIPAIGPQALAALQAYYRVNQMKTDPSSPTRKVFNSGVLISHIKAKAYLSGSQETETNIFRFPITVFASSYVPSPDGTIKCSAPGAVAVVNGRCGLMGQDGPICTN